MILASSLAERVERGGKKEWREEREEGPLAYP